MTATVDGKLLLQPQLNPMGMPSQAPAEIDARRTRQEKALEIAFIDPRDLVADFQTFTRLPQQMLTAKQQYAINQFAKGLLALGDDALIDTYHQALEDLRAARVKGSENLSKAYAQTLAIEKAMRDRFLIIEPAIKCGTLEQTRPHYPSASSPGTGNPPSVMRRLPVALQFRTASVGVGWPVGPCAAIKGFRIAANACRMKRWYSPALC
jgi:hypothetical protein